MSTRLLFLSAATLSLSVSMACASSNDKADAPTTTSNAEAGDGATTAVGMDGTWGEAALTCDGEANPRIPQITLEVSGGTGSFTLGFGPDCVATIPETYAFAGNVVSIAPQGVSCNPNGGCGAVFGGGDCLPGPPPPTDFEYVVAGDTLTLKKTSGGPPADNCPAGAVELYTMKRQ